MNVSYRIAARQALIAKLDAINRQRSLTEAESRQLEQTLYRERYYQHRAARRGVVAA